MLKHVAVVAIAIGLSPAVVKAAPYECTFMEELTQKATCTMDSESINASCKHDFEPKLQASCFTRSSGNVDTLRCVFHSGPLPGMNPSDSILQLSQKPGFRSGGATFVNPDSRNGALTVGYKEKDGQPNFVVLCTLAIKP